MQKEHRIAGDRVDVARVGVRVEVKNRDSPPAASARHAGDVGPRDGVVATEDERHGTGLSYALHDDLEVRAGARGIAAVHLHVAAVDLAALGAAVKWEPSRGGAFFPHLYRTLTLSDVVWDKSLPLGATGHIFPEGVF